MQYKDYYKILGVDEKADDATIKKAFRKLAKEYHPDKNKGDKKAEQRFKEISEAYEALSDKEKRQKYDALRQGFHGGNNAEFDPSQYGYRWSQPNSNSGYTYTSYSGGGDFSDFFDMLFGNRSNRFTGAKRQGFSGFDGFSRQSAGQDVEATLEITLEEGYHGGKKRIAIDIGGGRKTLDINIKPGMMEGEKIKLKGQGAQGGDLYLKVKLQSGAYRMERLDLIKELKIMPWDAALGATIQIPTLEGKAKVKIPAGANGGQRIRVSGKGYQNRQGKRGDLFIQVIIDNPKELNSEQRALYQKLKEAARAKRT